MFSTRLNCAVLFVTNPQSFVSGARTKVGIIASQRSHLARNPMAFQVIQNGICFMTLNCYGDRCNGNIISKDQTRNFSSPRKSILPNESRKNDVKAAHIASNLVASATNAPWSLTTSRHFATQLSFLSTISKSQAFSLGCNDAAKRMATRSLAMHGGDSVSNGALERDPFRDGKPTLDYARLMPKTFASMSNEQILQFAMLEIPEACRECIIRDVMTVDQIEYDEVCAIWYLLSHSNVNSPLLNRRLFEMLRLVNS